MNNSTDLILVAYASKHGATAEIARHIAQTLEQAGLPVEVRPVDEVDDVSFYAAVVLGSAVYTGGWRKEAARFLEANESQLAQRPVWLFSSGPTGEGDPVEIMDGWRFPEALQSLADRIQPRDIAFFHGVLELDRLNMVEKLLVKGIKAPLGDFRDWDAITRWAATIAQELSAQR